MPRPKTDAPIYDKANKLLDEMSEQVRVIATQEGFKPEALRVIVGVPDSFIARIFKRKWTGLSRSYNIISLLRILDFFGYDIMLVKRRETYKWADDAEIQARIYRYNNYNLTRETRKKPIDDGKPKGIEIRTRKRKGTFYDLARSKGVTLYSREEIDAAKRKDDFLA